MHFDIFVTLYFKRWFGYYLTIDEHIARFDAFYRFGATLYEPLVH